MTPYSDALYADLRREINRALLTAAPWAVVGGDADTSDHQDRPGVTTRYLWPAMARDDALVLASVRGMPAIRPPRQLAGDTALPGVVTRFPRRGAVTGPYSTKPAERRIWPAGTAHVEREQHKRVRRWQGAVIVVVWAMLIAHVLRGGMG